MSYSAAAHSEKEVSAYFTSVQIPSFGRAATDKRELNDASERKYILDLQVSTYSLLATLLQEKTVNAQFTRSQIMSFDFARIGQRRQLTTSIRFQIDTKTWKRTKCPKCIKTKINSAIR